MHRKYSRHTAGLRSPPLTPFLVLTSSPNQSLSVMQVGAACPGGPQGCIESPSTITQDMPKTCQQGHCTKFKSKQHSRPPHPFFSTCQCSAPMEWHVPLAMLSSPGICVPGGVLLAGGNCSLTVRAWDGTGDQNTLAVVPSAARWRAAVITSAGSFRTLSLHDMCFTSVCNGFRADQQCAGFSGRQGSCAEGLESCSVSSGTPPT